MIKINNVNKWYGDFQVLADCSTQIAKGEVVVVWPFRQRQIDAD